MTATFAGIVLAWVSGVFAATGGIVQDAPSGRGAPTPTRAFSNDQLEQIVAPIALYPDSVLMQICMAATYPIEVVQAARWVAGNSALEGDALEAALKQKNWDPSVKSLCSLPDVLKRMNDNLDWTQDLGDAFLGQQSELLDAVQRMRKKAVDAGSLKTSDEEKVTVDENDIVVIEPTDPETIYVPVYYPTAVYGGWAYPRWYYPTLYAAPPPGARAFYFTAGVAWGAAWGGCRWGWGHSEVDIDVNRYNNFVKNTDLDWTRNRIEGGVSDRAAWRHDPVHRGGVNYRDRATAERYGAALGSTRVSREQARGFAPSDWGAGGAGRVERPGEVGRVERPAGTRETLGSGARPETRGSSAARASGTRPSADGTRERWSAMSGSQNPSFDRAARSRGSESLGGASRAGGVRFGRGGRRR